MESLIRRIVFSPLLLVVLAIEGSPARAGVVAGGVLGGIQVRGTVVFTNTTGRDANDLEFVAYTKDGAIINGIRASTDAFDGGGVNLPPQSTAGSVGFNDGLVANGQQVRVDIDFFLAERNLLLICGAAWTDNGVPFGPPPIPPGGWRIRGPIGGGNGGNDNIGGGGQGGQQGGGGTGFFIHPVTIFNDDSKDVTLTSLKLLASMETYSDLTSSVPWNLVDPIDLGGPVTIPANSSFTYLFNTTGAYIDGHVYLTYTLEDPIAVFGDHPVVPEPATLGAGILGIVTLLGDRRYRGRRFGRTRPAA